METELFRREVLESRGTRCIGEIVLAHPLPIRVAATVAFVIILAIALFLVVGQYTRKVRVSGQIRPVAGAVRVVAPQAGRILDSKVKDGDVVTAGQLMFEIGNERMSGGLAVDRRIDVSLRARRVELVRARELQLQQLTQRQQVLNGKRRLIEEEILSHEQGLTLQKAQVESARETLNNHAALEQKGYVSSAQLRQIENEVTVQLSKCKTLEGSILRSRQELLQVHEDAQAISVQIELINSQASQNLASLEQEAAEHAGRSRLQIVAPAAGRVTAIPLESGQPVQAGSSLATILPVGSDLEAHLMVPSRGVGFIEPGQRVLLRLAAFSYQKFGQIPGEVIRVERSPIAEGQPDATGQANETIYRVVVKPDAQAVTAYGRTQQFKVGMTLEADILQDRRQLIEWVLDPVVSAAKGVP